MKALGRYKELPFKTLDDRNEATMELMSIANVPRFNWTIDPENGDITVRFDIICRICNG